MPYGVSINGEEDFNDKAEIINNSLDRRLKMLARDLVVYGSLIRGQFLQDITDDDISDTFAARYRIIINQPKTLDYIILVDSAALGSGITPYGIKTNSNTDQILLVDVGVNGLQVVLPLFLSF